MDDLIVLKALKDHKVTQDLPREQFVDLVIFTDVESSSLVGSALLPA